MLPTRAAATTLHLCTRNHYPVGGGARVRGDARGGRRLRPGSWASKLGAHPPLPGNTGRAGRGRDTTAPRRRPGRADRGRRGGGPHSVAASADIDLVSPARPGRLSTRPLLSPSLPLRRAPVRPTPARRPHPGSRLRCASACLGRRTSASRVPEDPHRQVPAPQAWEPALVGHGK